MSTKDPYLGDCPHCGCEILSHQTLIEYAGGVWAECPECRDVVDPQ
ncbi:DUF7837 family putative zinc-binding protein [Haloarchaeobius litoreus]